MQHEIATFLDFQLLYGWKETPEPAWSEDPSIQTQKGSGLLEEIKPSPKCAGAG